MGSDPFRCRSIPGNAAKLGPRQHRRAPWRSVRPLAGTSDPSPGRLNGSDPFRCRSIPATQRSSDHGGIVARRGEASGPWRDRQTPCREAEPDGVALGSTAEVQQSRRPSEALPKPDRVAAPRKRCRSPAGSDPFPPRPGITTVRCPRRCAKRRRCRNKGPTLAENARRERLVKPRGSCRRSGGAVRGR